MMNWQKTVYKRYEVGFFGFLLLCAMFLLIISPVCQGQDWNQWKGPRRNNKSPSTGLNFKWEGQGPRLVWKADGLGEGYSNLSFYQDKIFTMGDIGNDSCLVALDRASGSVLWKTPVGPSRGVGYPGPRSTPATDGQFVWGMDQHANLICVEAQTGKEVWKKNFLQDFNGVLQLYHGRESWGFAESPLLIGKYLYCVPGGDKGAVVALDKTTGKQIWRSTELKDKCTYASIVPVVIDSVGQLLVVTDQRLSGLNYKTGKLLWSVEYPGPGITACDPVFEKNFAFITCDYGMGAFGYEIRKNGTAFKAKEIYSLRNVDNKHHGVIVDNGYVYSSTERRQLVCIDIQTGEIKWTKEHMNGGKSSLGFADGKIIARGEDGTVTIVEANPAEYREVASFMQPERSNCNAWTYPVVVDGKLYLRDQGRLFCYSL